MIKSSYMKNLHSVNTMDREALLNQLRIAGKQEARLSLLFRNQLALKAGLPPTDMECIDILLEQENVTPGDLSKQTGISSGAMTAALARLEKKNMVIREHSKHDRRKVIVKPVMENIVPLFSLYESFVRKADMLLADYSDEELAVILRHYKQMSRIYESELA